jgi:outer membrane protein assembly factor BamB
VKPHYGYGASPVIEGDLLLLTANTSGLALNRKTGAVVWDGEKPPEKKHWTSLSSYEGIHGVDIENGQVLWLYEWEYFRRQVADPLVFDNKVFIAKYAVLGSILLDVGGGVATVLWKNPNMSSDIASPVMIDGYIYGVEGGVEVNHCSVRCIAAETGEVMWDEKMGKEAVSLIPAGNRLIILEDKGILHIAEATPASYQEISSCDVL